MKIQSSVLPDPDFNPSIPAKPVPDKAEKPEKESIPETPGEDELPSPAIFPTA